MTDLQNTQNTHEQENIRLIKAFMAGDQTAFDRLIVLNQKMVFNLCYRFLGNYDDADDCAQEVFIKVYHSLKKFRFESRFTTWLYRVTVNVCKNRLGSLEYRLRRRRIRINQKRNKGNNSPALEIKDESLSPDSTIKRKEIDRLIREAVGRLPAPQKLVVVLRDMEGRSYEEIVEVTGFKLGTVKSKLSRARQQLRVKLKGRF
jgi:RNA polymerase sigma-70 factor (ECF subfamily)